MISAAKKLTLALVAGLTLSVVPAQEARAFAPVDAFCKLTTCQKVSVIAAIILTPYLMNFLTRKPLTAPRFDKEKLLHGSISEKVKHLHYFFSDIVLGWPRKDGKIKIVEDSEPGKYRQDINLGQDPAGLLGHSMDQAETAVKALGIPAKFLNSILLVGTSILAITALGKEKAAKPNIITLSDDTIAKFAAVLKS